MLSASFSLPLRASLESSSQASGCIVSDINSRVGRGGRVVARGRSKLRARGQSRLRGRRRLRARGSSRLRARGSSRLHQVNEVFKGHNTAFTNFMSFPIRIFPLRVVRRGMPVVVLVVHRAPHRLPARRHRWTRGNRRNNRRNRRTRGNRRNRADCGHCGLVGT